MVRSMTERRAVVPSSSLAVMGGPVRDESALCAERSLAEGVFFCACERPASCHRHTVARLVLREAHRRGASVAVVEWRGGEARVLTVETSAPVLRQVSRGTRRTLGIPASMSLDRGAPMR